METKYLKTVKKDKDEQKLFKKPHCPKTSTDDMVKRLQEIKRGEVRQCSSVNYTYLSMTLETEGTPPSVEIRIESRKPKTTRKTSDGMRTHKVFISRCL